MGMLVEGKWVDRWYDTKSTDGRFVRPETQFRCGEGGLGEAGFAPEAGRYHLYISYACPWASRCSAARGLLGLDEVIGMSSVAPLMLDDGWAFDADWPDPVGSRQFLREIYVAHQADYTGRVTVPILWDKRDGRIVCNESSEILRLLSRDFAGLARTPIDLRPDELRSELDPWNDRIYHTLNNGVYRAGFATKQAAYEEAVGPLFDTLDALEARLADRRFLFGDTIVETDLRLFPTLIRFDAVYYGHFKCNLRRLVDYPNLWRYTREVLALPGVAETVDLPHAKLHYFGSHESINPTRIVPVGPELDLSL